VLNSLQLRDDSVILKLSFCPQKILSFNDADVMIRALGHLHNPEDWRLFIDSSKFSLNIVLLHSGNIYPSAPLAYPVYMTESHEKMRTALTVTV
jgi:hypothetical protein